MFPTSFVFSIFPHFLEEVESLEKAASCSSCVILLTTGGLFEVIPYFQPTSQPEHPLD